MRYRYENRIEIIASNYSEAKRIIESRIRRPMNPFRLEVFSAGHYVSAV
jgi:hypothetical protein